MKKQKGFTPIELMIAIAIISILSMVATEYYGDYIIRVQVSEGVNLSRPLQLAIVEYYNTEGTLPDNVTLDLDGKFTDSVVFNGRQLEIKYGGEANEAIRDHVLYLIFVVNENGTVNLVCSSGPNSLPDEYLPSGFSKEIGGGFWPV